MTPDNAIRFAMRAFLEEYGGDRFKVTKERRALWSELLADMGAEIVLAATKQILADPSPFPPTVGQVRAKCVEIATGAIGGETATQAWDTVLAFCADKVGKDALSKRCLATLRHVGGSWAVMRSEEPGILRSQFMKAFESCTEATRKDAQTLPEVKELADSQCEKRLAELAGKVGR
jgi:hypothetical protein